MDNQFTRLDSYGRIVSVPVYPGVSTNPDVKQPETEPAWAECEEVWARTERVKRLEDTVIMLTDRVNQCSIRIAALEISPLQKMPEESKSIGNIAEPPLTFAQLQGSVRELWDKVDALQLANYEITRTLSEMSNEIFKTNTWRSSSWVEEELAKIKELPNERTCQHCKWGTKNPHNDEKISCHHDPYYNANAKDYWCSRWCEK